MNIKFSFILTTVTIGLFCLIGGMSAANQSVDLVFEVQPDSSSEVGAKVTGGAFGRDTIDYSGTINAQVVYDDESLKPQSITFTGGRVAATDSDLSFSGNVTIIGYGQYYMYFTVRTRSIAATYSSLAGASAIAADGSFDTSKPTVRLNEGVSSMSISIPSIPGYGTETESVDFSLNPEQDQLGGTASLIAEVVPINVFERKLVFTMTMTPDPEEVERLDDTYSDITLTEVGTITSTASLTIPTAFGNWLEEAELKLVSGAETNSSGVPYRLLHAFGLSSYAGAVPMVFGQDVEHGLVLCLTLPPAGLAESVKIQYRERLSEGQWLDLPSVHMLSGEDSLTLGQTGDVELSFPDAEQCFVRVTVAD